MASPARIWVISDTHFGHDNMYMFLRQDGLTRVRPGFQSSADADAHMVRAWNARVHAADHVYHLGDVGFGPTFLDLVKHLAGHKRLILGNHDKEDVRKYREAGFQKVFGSRQHEGCWLTHIPMHPSTIGEGKLNIHGHIHERLVMRTTSWARSVEDGQPLPMGREPDPRYRNVCVEHTNYAPVLLNDVKVYQPPTA
jgi:calcineurin-like phosphoesterase family protein